jgi:hypothetical protein
VIWPGSHSMPGLLATGAAGTDPGRWLPQVDGLPPGWLATVAALMHGVIGASLLSTLILALMLGLWLDRETEAGDWRRKFLELRLGRVLSLVTALAVLLLAAGFVSLGGGLLLVLGTGFAAQGLAVVHWTADDGADPGSGPWCSTAAPARGAAGRPAAGGAGNCRLGGQQFRPAPAPVECGLIRAPAGRQTQL